MADVVQVNALVDVVDVSSASELAVHETCVLLRRFAQSRGDVKARACKAARMCVRCACAVCRASGGDARRNLLDPNSVFPTLFVFCTFVNTPFVFVRTFLVDYSREYK